MRNSPGQECAIPDVAKRYKEQTRKALDLSEHGFKSLRELIDSPRQQTLEVKQGFLRLRTSPAARPLRAPPLAPRVHSRVASFDVHDGYKLVPVHQLRPGSALLLAPVENSVDLEPLLCCFPLQLATTVRAFVDSGANVSDLQLDVGAQPSATVDGKRRELGQDFVNQQLLDAICSGRTFNAENRASLDGQLHRLSRMVSDQVDANGQARTIGLTLRIGRHATGRAHLFADVLLGSDKSVLVLGRPNTGKSVLVREACALLAACKNVVAIDSSKELGGDGDVPHRALGRARRMLVGFGQTHESAMLECVKNHAPDVIVIDEIMGSSITHAARECKTRGVRIIASAHGTLKDLLDSELKPLVGGVSTVTVGDITAHGGSKLRTERRGEPVFDVIVELQEGKFTSVVVIPDARAAVDSCLSDREAPLLGAQERARVQAVGAFTWHDTQVQVSNMGA